MGMALVNKGTTVDILVDDEGSFNLEMEFSWMDSQSHQGIATIKYTKTISIDENTVTERYNETLNVDTSSPMIFRVITTETEETTSTTSSPRTSTARSNAPDTSTTRSKSSAVNLPNTSPLPNGSFVGTVSWSFAIRAPKTSSCVVAYVIMGVESLLLALIFMAGLIFLLRSRGFCSCNISLPLLKRTRKGKTPPNPPPKIITRQETIEQNDYEDVDQYRLDNFREQRNPDEENYEDTWHTDIRNRQV